MGGFAELNVDGMVGPTHTYAGQALGNRASEASGGRPSHPLAAARQGIAKMSLVHRLGVPQAVLPPHERPAITILRSLGFDGTDSQVLKKCYRDSPALLYAVSSASSMWAANSATVTGGPDSRDGRVHVTPANLVANLHRSIEAPFTARLLKIIFSDRDVFAHHDPLPACLTLRDEGAANHVRLTPHYGTPALNVFVSAELRPGRAAAVFPRQSRAASEAIARMHLLDPDRVMFVAQAQRAVDRGAFHNDVLCASNLSFLLVHEAAFHGGYEDIHRIWANYLSAHGVSLHLRVITSDELTLDEAVGSYLFNCQLVVGADGLVCVAPIESRESEPARNILHGLLADPESPVQAVEFLDLRQSMRNGGGPACLRLRVPLTSEGLLGIRQSVLFNDELEAKVLAIVSRYYREALELKDLQDPALLDDSRRALDELTQVLGLGSIYEFQMDGIAHPKQSEGSHAQ